MTHSVELLHNARRNRERAREARRLTRAEPGRNGNEQLRLYAARLEDAARSAERRVVASKAADARPVD